MGKGLDVVGDMLATRDGIEPEQITPEYIHGMRVYMDADVGWSAHTPEKRAKLCKKWAPLVLAKIASRQPVCTA